MSHKNANLKWRLSKKTTKYKYNQTSGLRQHKLKVRTKMDVI